MAVGKTTGKFFLPHNDPKPIFVQAEEFHDACALLGRFATLHARHVGIPLTICSAFALELYLKCLIVIEGNSAPRIHDLDKLFDRIGPLNQSRIRAYFNSKAPEMARFFARVNNELQYQMMPPTPDFDQQLKASADAFTIMRYLHEPLRSRRYPAGYYAYAIEDGARDTILQIHPEWKGAKFPYP